MQTAFHSTIFLLAALILLASPEAGAQATEDATQVRPGSVVRWSGEALESCALDGRSWAPLDGACLYPIDLLATGSLELERRAGGERQTRRVEVADYPYDVQRIELEDDTHVNLSPENAARAGRESKRVGALWTSAQEVELALPLSAPLAELPPGGRFGARRIINGQPRNPHTGVDYAADAGTAVLAVADGVVVLAEEHFFAGNSVFIDHGRGLISMSFHLSEIVAAQGQRVRRGDVIGEVGATGRATGPHLHFGLRWHGWRVDPGPLFEPTANE